MHKLVGQAEIKLPGGVGTAAAVRRIEATAHMLEAVADAVVGIEHVAHGVEAEAVHMKLFHPVSAVGKQEAAGHVPAEIKGRRAPLIGTLIKEIGACIVARQALLGIGTGMGVRNVKNHGNAQAVRFIHQVTEPVRLPVARRRRKITAHLITEGLIKRMFRHAHELYGGISAGFYARQHVANEIVVTAYGAGRVIAGILRHAYVRLVNARKLRPYGTGMTELIRLFRVPHAGAPHIGIAFVLLHPAGEGRHAAHNARLSRAFQMQLVVIAVGKRVLRQIDAPESAASVHHLPFGTTLEIRTVRDQPHTGGLRHPFRHEPGVSPLGIKDLMQSQSFMQIGIMHKRAVAPAQTRHFILKTLRSLSQEGTIVGKLIIGQRIQKRHAKLLARSFHRQVPPHRTLLPLIIVEPASGDAPLFTEA